MKIVFIHGAGTSGLSFYYQTKHFRNSKAIDLPGHPVGTPCDTISEYVEWVRGFIAARGYKDIVLCGHSMGGAISLLYALKYPTEVKGLVLMNTGGKLRVSKTILDSCKIESKDQLNTWAKYHKANYECPDRDIQELLTQKTVAIGPSTEQHDLKACNDFDVMSSLPNLTIPTNIICGSEDQLTPVKYAKHLNSEIKNSEITIVPNSKHFSMLDNHKQVNQSIDSFLYKLKDNNTITP